ncbi:hypothetical protein ES705_15968 [subsurface metagenome]
MSEAEIIARFKNYHDELSVNYYAGTSGLTKEEFDTQHGQVWAHMEAELIAKGYRIHPIPARDLTAEIDDLKARVKKLEK